MSAFVSPVTGPAARPLQRHMAHGFTLMELMVVVTLLAIIAAVAAPSFRDFLAGQQVKGLAFEMTNDLLLARSEALKRNASVSVVPSDSNWRNGWTTSTVLTTERISTRNASAQAVTVSGAPTAITFDVNGRVSSPSSEVRVSITSNSTSRCVELSPSGRARSSVGACT